MASKEKLLISTNFWILTIPTIYDLETHSPGPEGSLPLTSEMLLDLPSGDVFGLEP